MTGPNEAIMDQAVAWHLRLADADAAAWNSFNDWLEADPAHADAYDRVALAGDGLEGLAPAPAPAPRPQIEPDHSENVVPLRRGPTRRVVFGMAVAAAFAGVVGVGMLRTSADLYPVETAPGARQQIALADGSRIDVNGGTRLLLDRNNPRFARLERGEALFTVVHDDARPFEVEAAGATLRDMGTVFNVVSDDGDLEVSVAEGAVLYNPGDEAINLRPGMALNRPAGRPAQVARVDMSAVSAWRDGRLVYAGAPASRIAADLSRNLGVRVQASPPAAGRPFTGVIRLDGSAPAVIERAGTLMGARVRRDGPGDGGGWTLLVGAGMVGAGGTP